MSQKNIAVGRQYSSQINTRVLRVVHSIASVHQTEHSERQNVTEWVR